MKDPKDMSDAMLLDSIRKLFGEMDFLDSDLIDSNFMEKVSRRIDQLKKESLRRMGGGAVNVGDPDFFSKIDPRHKKLLQDMLDADRRAAQRGRKQASELKNQALQIMRQAKSACPL